MSGNRYAVLVASSRFPDEPKLPELACPENDVDGLHEVMRAPEHGGFAEVNVLKNRPHFEVLRRINQVLKRADKNDLVLLYYSGHGKLDSAGRLHLATVDTVVADLESTSVPVQSIKNFIDVSPATKTALILDCCYSGAVEKSFFRGAVDDQLNLMAGGRGTFIMTASTGIQAAKEKEETRYGIFTRHLVDGIRSGEADRDADGLITMNELYKYAHEKVLDESHQEPMKWDLNVRGELVIARGGSERWAERAQRIRERLLALASEHVLPTSIVAKGLEVSALGRAELVGELRQYDALLDQLIADDFRAGEFIEAWWRVRPAPGPASAPPPHEEPGPRGEPAGAGEAGRADFTDPAAGGRAPHERSSPLVRLRAFVRQFVAWPLTPPGRGAGTAFRTASGGADGIPAARRGALEGMLFVLWVVGAFFLAAATTGIFDAGRLSYSGSSYDAETSGLLTGFLLAGLSGVWVLRKRRHQLGAAIAWLYRLCIGAAFVVSFFMLVELA